MLFAFSSRGEYEVKPDSGFTLIELIFVVAIIAILLALAYPSFVEQVRKARRADAAASLMSTAQTLERCFTRNNTYVACIPNEITSADGHYTITPTDNPGITASVYEIQAAPNGDQVNDPCGTYTLDHLGNKTADSETNRCWGS